MRIKRSAKMYLDRAINSVRLAIEHFNRPYEEGRQEAVLHFALYAQEMLMKAVLVQRGKQIHMRRESKNTTFGKAMHLLGKEGEKLLSESEVLSLTALSNMRDAAQHSVVTVCAICRGLPRRRLERKTVAGRPAETGVARTGSLP